MTRNALLRLLVIATASFSCGSAASAASAEWSKIYVEGLVGVTSFDLSTGAFTSNTFTNQTPVAGQPLNTISITGRDSSGTALGVRVGYQANSWLAFEVTHVNAGTAQIRGTGVLYSPVASASPVTFSTDLNVTEWAGGIAASYSFQEKLSVVGRVGLNVSNAKWGNTTSASVVPANATAPSAGRILQDAFRRAERSTAYTYGLAVSYQFSPKVSAGLGYDLFEGRQYAKITSGHVRYSF